MISKILQTTFKKFVSYIFKIFHGNIKGVVKLDKNQEELLEVSFNNKYRYSIYICKHSRIYTDTIHDTAFIKNNFIIEGPSFQFRNNVIADCNKNIVFKKGTPRIKKKIKR